MKSTSLKRYVLTQWYLLWWKRRIVQCFPHYIKRGVYKTSPMQVVRRIFCGRVCTSHIPLSMSHTCGSYSCCTGYRLI